MQKAAAQRAGTARDMHMQWLQQQCMYSWEAARWLWVRERAGSRCSNALLGSTGRVKGEVLAAFSNPAWKHM